MPLTEAMATLIGGAISSAAGIYAQHKNNEAAKRESELAFRRSQMEIAQQNQYNSPAEQVARLRAAGLSPNLAYGASGETVGNQASTPEYTPAPYESVLNPGTADASAMIDSLVGLREQQNRNTLTEADLILKEDVHLLNGANLKLTDANCRAVLEMLDLNKEAKRVEIAVGRAKEAEIQQNCKNLIHAMMNLDATRALVRKQWQLTDAQVRSLNAQELSTLFLMDGIDKLNKASAAERRAMAASAYEQMSYFGKYYDLHKNQFEFEKEFSGKKLTQGYWNMGVQGFTSILGTAANFLGPAKGIRSIGNIFMGNSGLPTGTDGQWNSGTSDRGDYEPSGMFFGD